MAYVSQDLKKSSTPKIKEILKKYDMKGTLSVNNHSTLVLNISKGKLDIMENSYEINKENEWKRPQYPVEKQTSLQVNTYWIKDHFSGKVAMFLSEMVEAMKGPDFFDHSDSMTDYFHRSHYYEICVGRWNKPYILL